MKKLIAMFLAIVFSLTFVGYAFCEEGLMISTTEAESEPKMEQKNPAVAATIAIIPPLSFPPLSWLGLGHAYAGDWNRSFPFILLDLVGIVVCLSSTQHELDLFEPDIETTYEQPGHSIGVGLLVISAIWRSYDAYLTADDYNKKLENKDRLEVGLREGLPVLQISHKF